LRFCNTSSDLVLLSLTVFGINGGFKLDESHSGVGSRSKFCILLLILLFGLSAENVGAPT